MNNSTNIESGESLRQPRILFRRLSLFLIPLLVIFTPPIIVLVRCGELEAIDVRFVVKMQHAKDSLVLYGPAYSDCTKLYKLEGAKAAKAGVLVLGTSRSMQFRSAMFSSNVRFYNAGGGLRELDTFPPS